MYISAHGLFSDVWASWTELGLNLTITLCLAPFYGIVGILMGKILSVFFIATFWKPYFLFSHGLHLKVSTYWKGMFPYYTIFTFFTIIVLCSKMIIPDMTHSMPELICYGGIIFFPIIVLYFATLFMATKGMKYFVARKPALFNICQKITIK